MSSSNQRPANRGFRSVLRCAISHYRQSPSLSAPEPLRLLLLVWRRSPDPDCRLVAAGLAWGLFAQFLYQMTDAIPLGAKLGIFFWVAMALSATVLRRSGAIEAGQFRGWFYPSAGTPALLWLLVSLLAISLVEEHPFVGLGIAIVGGILMGYLALESHLLLLSELQPIAPPKTK